MRNFGFESETSVVDVGINAKLDEVRATFGLINLKMVNKAIEHCRILTENYRDAFRILSDIEFINEKSGVPTIIPTSRYS